MKITIDSIVPEGLLSSVESSVGEQIIGGDLINARVSASASSNGASALGSARVFAFGSNLFGNFEVTLETGQQGSSNFARSSSFSFAQSG